MDGFEKIIICGLICMTIMFYFETTKEHRERMNRIEELRQLKDLKSGIQLKMYLEESDSIINEMDKTGI